MDIKDVIARGENKVVEFKSWVKIPNKKELMEILTNETVGFSNAEGGIILVGVEDNGEITGCQDYDEQSIIESIYDRTVPKVFTDIENITIDGKEILKIIVPKAPETVATSRGTVYKRLGKNTKPFYPGEYQSNIIQGFKGDFSAKILKDTSEFDIDFHEVESLKLKIKSRDKDSTLYQEDDLSFLRDLRLIEDNSDGVRLTIAGLLCKRQITHTF
ncbi:AlbA family DNA-binding domain-containing protein [Robertmurraya massiliosenegalensis]|uniref:AlbA family DNA-binding domain-containing protein n=1 Tax=Robertmurraya massiliosenegalensis TaxID=1287657 RepID=UPI0002E3B55D|nr:ATP-binding protein [Robertmurraya massiliosenegalensis]